MDPYSNRQPARQTAEQLARTADENARRRHREEVKGLEAIADATLQVQDATLQVHAEVQRLAAETARAQRLAVWVGVGTAVLGSILGGFAGAVAAQIIGG